MIYQFEECDAIIQRKVSLKQQDAGYFTISCVIGGKIFNKVLCESGASINLMPMSIFQKFEIRIINLATITLQMVDRLLTYPKGIVEDMLVKVNQFIFLVDFIMLDMEGDRNIPLILGISFLAMGDVHIDVRKGELTLCVDEENITFFFYLK